MFQNSSIVQQVAQGNFGGNDDLASVRVSDSQSVCDGVTADSRAFEQARRAMNLVANTRSTKRSISPGRSTASA